MAMSCTSPGKSNPKSTLGGQERVETYDRDGTSLLKKVLLELERMNVHLSLITNEEFNHPQEG